MMAGGDVPVRVVQFSDVKNADVAVADLKPDTTNAVKNSTIDQYILAAVNFARKPDCGAWCWASEYNMALSRLSSPLVAIRIYRSDQCAEVDAALRQAAINVFWSSDRDIIDHVRLGVATYCQNDIAYLQLSGEKNRCIADKAKIEGELVQCRTDLEAAKTAAPTGHAKAASNKDAGKGKKAHAREEKVEPSPQHTECVSNRCLTVAGAGEDRCVNDVVCEPKPIECKPTQTLEGGICRDKPEPKARPKVIPYK
ncbi:MAG: hypothetical protein HY877_02920 [Deltaproteobacteria bacterium]|nr:hypothetical protein [Deltaproteobacteria bacterium]